MKLKDFKIFIFLFIFSFSSYSQNKISGYVSEKLTNFRLDGVTIYDLESGLIGNTKSDGYYEILTEKKLITLVFIAGSSVPSVVSGESLLTKISNKTFPSPIILGVTVKDKATSLNSTVASPSEITV